MPKIHTDVGSSAYIEIIREQMRMNDAGLDASDFTEALTRLILRGARGVEATSAQPVPAPVPAPMVLGPNMVSVTLEELENWEKRLRKITELTPPGWSLVNGVRKEITAKADLIRVF